MKKYTVTGKVDRGLSSYKFFIFGDSEEIGDYVLMSNLSIYVFINDKMETSNMYDRFKDKAIIINKVNNKGMLYDPNVSSKEQVMIGVENEQNHFSLVLAESDVLDFIKETQ